MVVHTCTGYKFDSALSFCLALCHSLPLPLPLLLPLPLPLTHFSPFFQILSNRIREINIDRQIYVEIRNKASV